jgi:N utilization substance protein B
MATASKTQKPSPKAKALSARLLAVQAVFQALHNKQGITSVMEEYLVFRTSASVDGEKLVQPDGALFKNIMQGIHDRKEDLEHVIAHHFPKEKQDKEPLMLAIFTCGAYELLAHDTIDVPILINDYLNVAHSFFNDSETGLINAVLDSIAKAVRA